MTAPLSSPLRLGLWLDDLGLGVKDGLKRVATWGLEDLGLDAFGREVGPRNLSQTGRRELVHRIHAAGARLSVLRADVGARRLNDPQLLDTHVMRIREAFDLARSLGAQRIMTPLGFVPPAQDAAAAPARRALIEGVRALLASSSETGVRPVVPAGSEAPADLIAFLAEIDSSGLIDVDLNPGGLISRGVDPLAAVQIFSRRVGLASLADAYRGGAEAPFGRGDVPWGELLIALSTLSRTEPLSALAACHRECDRSAALKTALERLKRLRLNPLSA